MSASPNVDTGLRGWAYEIRRTGWIYVVLGLVISVIAGNPLSPDWVQTLWRVVTFLTVSCCIGLAVTGTYAFVTTPVTRHLAGRPILIGFVHLLTLATSIGLGTELALAAFGLMFGDAFDPTQARGLSWRIGVAVGLVVMIASVVFDGMRERTLEVERRAARTQHELLEARFAAMQARTNPHFLFNSLNTIADLIETDPERAVDAVERLSELLRYTLEGSMSERVSFSRELAAVHDYLGLERLRFGDRLRTEFSIGEDIDHVPIPPLVLQPVVENAVKHGVASRREGATIWIRARQTDDGLEIVVEDDGEGVQSRAQPPGTSTGQANLEGRLDLVYGDRSRLEAGPRDQGGYRVFMLLPIDEPKAVRT